MDSKSYRLYTISRSLHTQEMYSANKFVSSCEKYYRIMIKLAKLGYDLDLLIFKVKTLVIKAIMKLK